MKWTMQTKTIEVCTIDRDKYMHIRTIKGNNLFNCLSHVSEDIECMVTDGDLTTVEGILGRIQMNNYVDEEDYVYYIKDVTNKDYVYVDDQCIMDYVYTDGQCTMNSARICKNYEWR